MFAKQGIQFRAFKAGELLTIERVFAGLSAKALDRFFRVCKPLEIQKGHFVLAANKIPPGIFILAKGRAIVFEDLGYGENVNLRLAFPNEVFGLTETVAGVGSSFNVETLSDCVFRYIDRVELLRFLANERIVCFRVARLLGEREAQRFEFGYRSDVNRLRSSPPGF